MWEPEPAAGGSYAVWDATAEEMLWATRTTKNGKYTDDVLFEFFADSTDFNAGSCTVKAKSRSRSLSYYDYSTNYCNMANVLHTVAGSADVSASVTECKFVPKDPAATCLTY